MAKGWILECTSGENLTLFSCCNLYQNFHLSGQNFLKFHYRSMLNYEGSNFLKFSKLLEYKKLIQAGRS